MYIGVDFQVVRDCSYAVMNAGGDVIRNGWITSTEASTTLIALGKAYPGAVVGIDAPRMPLPAPRQHYWNGRERNWRSSRNTDRGFGRHCEVVIAACELARPQWTPTINTNLPHWMAQGFELFASLRHAGIRVEEVFPSAAYRMLDDERNIFITMPLSGFLPGPKDMLDAVVAAFALREYIQGRGCEVGGGDGLGTIVLPRSVDHPNFDLVSTWPDEAIR